MLDIRETARTAHRALLVGVVFPGGSVETEERLLDELAELVETLFIQVGGRRIVRLREPNPRFLIGEGKMRAILQEAHDLQCEVIVFDEEISPGQQRNWEMEDRSLAVVDRQEIILDIFSERARTKEASLQVELARLEYTLPRLQRAWTHLNRQRGGGAIQRDTGETQLELDQRLVRTRIAKVRRDLEEVVRHRSVQRGRRMKVPLPTAAIVGYTNAGKSSLLNALTGAGVLAENRLFATLDPTSRRLALPTGQNLILTDTVGFVRRLPHRLIEAFKATLEEALVSDFLIHVVDLANPEHQEHQETTLSVLRELGADLDQLITVYNKIDLLDPSLRAAFLQLHPRAILLSAHTGEGFPLLFQRLHEQISGPEPPRLLLIPHDHYPLVARLHEAGAVRESVTLDEGTRLLATIPPKLLPLLQPFLLP